MAKTTKPAPAASNFKSAIKQLAKLWKDGKDKKMGVPEGEYVMRLTKADFVQAGSAKRWGVSRSHMILAGEHSGSEVRDRITFDTEMGPYFTAQFFDQMGYEAPEDIGDFPEALASIVAEGPVYRASVTTSGDFQNIRISELIDPDDVEEVLESEGGDEEEYEEEEGEDEEAEEGDEDEEAEEDEEEGDEEEDEDAEEDEEEEDEDEDAEEDDEEEEEEFFSEEEAELHEALVGLAAAFGIPDISEENTIEEITAVFTEGVEWDRDSLEPDEAALLESIGAIPALKKKAAKPTKAAPASKVKTKSKKK